MKILMCMLFSRLLSEKAQIAVSRWGGGHVPLSEQFCKDEKEDRGVGRSHVCANKGLSPAVRQAYIVKDDNVCLAVRVG